MPASARKTLTAAVLVSKFDAGLRLGDRLVDQFHCPGAMAAFVRGGLPKFAKRLMERAECALHVALVGTGRICRGAGSPDCGGACRSSGGKAAACHFRIKHDVSFLMKRGSKCAKRSNSLFRER